MEDFGGGPGRGMTFEIWTNKMTNKKSLESRNLKSKVINMK